MIGFIDSAAVYTPAGSDGDYTVLAQTLVSARLVITPVTAPAGTGRAELLAAPRLLWTDAYVMPSPAQIEVAGVRYNVKPGTYDALRGPSGAVLYRRCDVSAVS